MTKEIATIEGQYRVVEALMPTSDAVAAWKQYQELTRALLDPNDYQTFQEGGKKVTFKKKSGWRKLARFFGISLEMVDERLAHNHQPATCARIKFPEVMAQEKDCGCPLKLARYVVRATAPNGRSVTAVGLCSTSEPRKFTRQEHDLATTAYTRAANRAISDLLGAGEDSAEETSSSGLPQEDLAMIGRAWQGADDVTKASALDRMREWGFKGADRKALFTDFNRRADGEQVNALLEALGVGSDFDPDAAMEEAGSGTAT